MSDNLIEAKSDAKLNKSPHVPNLGKAGRIFFQGLELLTYCFSKVWNFFRRESRVASVWSPSSTKPSSLLASASGSSALASCNSALQATASRKQTESLLEGRVPAIAMAAAGAPRGLGASGLSRGAGPEENLNKTKWTITRSEPFRARLANRHELFSLTFFVALALLLLAESGLAQTSTQGFGTGTGTHSSQTASTTFIPNPSSGTTYARGGATAPNAPVVLATASNPLGTVNTYVRAVASTSASVTKMSPIVGYSGSTEFYTSFKVLFGDSSAGTSATSGIWYFAQGAGAMYSDNNNFANAQTFALLRFTYGASGAITLAYNDNGTFGSSGLTTTSFSQGTVYTIEIVANNKTSGTINYTYNGNSQSVAVQKFDLYINGTLVGDDLTKNTIAANTSLNAMTFIGVSSTANAANIFVDDVVVYNAVPATIGTSCGDCDQTVNYVMQTGNFNQFRNQNSTGGWWNPNGTEIGMWANGSGGNNGAAGFQTFTTTGVGGSGDARPLQIGDEFTITTYSANNPWNYYGISFNDSTTYSAFSDLSTGRRMAWELGSSGNYGVIRNGGTTSSSLGPGADRTLKVKPTSSSTFNATIGGTTYYDLTMLGSPGVNDRIRSFAIYVQDDNGDKFWKNGSVHDTGALEFGGNDNTTTIAGRIADGLAADCTVGSCANKVFKIGTGTITFSDSGNTYSGGTQIENGTLQISADGNLGSTPASPTANHLTIWSSGTLRSSATMTLNANRGIALGDTAGPSISVASGTTLTYGGIMTGAAAWNKKEAGTLRLTSTAGANTGIATIQAGTLQITDDRALGAVPGSAAERINIWSTGTFEADATFTLNANRRIELGTVAGPKISVTSGNTLTYAGQISGSANWSKESAGTLTLSGTSTMTGNTTVNAGTIIMSGSANSSAFTVASGATLAGAGTVGNLTINGTVSPGNTTGARATLSAGAINLGSGGSYTFDISNVTGTPGTDWDRVNGSGTLTVNASGTFTINVNGNPTGFSDAGNYAWVIMSGSSVSGFNVARFAINTSGFTPSFTGTFSIDQSGNDIRLVYSSVGASPPSVTTSAGTATNTTTATVGGDVTADGGATVTNRGAVYKTTAGVTISDNKTQSGSGTGTFNVNLTSLSVNQQYYYRAYAQNSAGTTLGSELQFWTWANTPSAPTVNNPTTSSLDVNVNPNSNPAATIFSIQST
ncbi:MAG TPA: autotransporter-associated beta strand repeat-containing protein, partial [Kiritimatiellia bacterium]|nr:autotransporter-associated beta strand repeat-containing protein [Kiritimatiellia bacterium]